MCRVRSISNDAFWERSGFGGDGNSEVKLAHSGVILGWVTSGEASRQVAPESKTVSGITPNGFTFGSCLPASFPGGHPSCDYSGVSKLNFGVPIPSEATALPKRVVTPKPLPSKTRRYLLT